MDHNLFCKKQYIISFSIYIFLIYFTKIQTINLYNQQHNNKYLSKLVNTDYNLQIYYHFLK